MLIFSSLSRNTRAIKAKKHHDALAFTLDEPAETPRNRENERSKKPPMSISSSPGFDDAFFVEYAV